MTFVSLQFLLFLPAVTLLYFLIPHKARWILLLAASYYAYMSWNALLIFPIMATTLISYLTALFTGRTKSVRVKKLMLAIALIVCLGTLVFFKYFGFLLDNAVAFLNLFAMDLTAPEFNIILPVGISFYTFQTLSYVIDVYRRKFAPEKHLGYYALYVSFFPQLVAGPIERPENLLPQLKEKHSFGGENLSAGLRLMASGYFRKCVVADFFGVFVNNVFSNLSGASGLAVVAAGALFVVQVYCDFAGYSEIAAGASRIMGIKLMQNFDKPFAAVSIRDLMRRWHISLNTWFRDYVYIPLGGSRKGRFRQVLNVLIVYFLCGLWHGAAWTFVLWGLYVGVFLCVESFLRKPYHALCRRLKIDNSSVPVIAVRRIIVFLFFIPAALFFRSGSVSEIGVVFTRIFTAGGLSGEYLALSLEALGMNTLDILRLGLCVICLTRLYAMAYYSPQQSGAEFERTGEAVGHSVHTNNAEGQSLENAQAECVPVAQGAARTEMLKEPARRRTDYAMRASGLFYSVLAAALGWLILISTEGLSAFVYFQF